MLRKLILFIWSKISRALFWLLEIVHLRRKSECTTVSKPNNDNNKSSNLTRLPDKLLLNIFDRVPVNDLVCKIPRTCSQFARINIEACNRRRSLKIIFEPESEQNNPICTLKFNTISQLNVQNCTKIISTFPNVRSLQLNASSVTVSQLNESIIDILLSCLYDQLEALHLELTFECHVRGWANIVRIFMKRHKPMQDGCIDGLERAFKLINRMSRLKRLSVCTGTRNPIPQLSIIAQLNELYLFSSAISNHHFDSLLEHGGQLKRIGIGTFVDNIPLCRRWTRTKKLFLSKITHFGLKIDPQNVDPQSIDPMKCYPIDNFRDMLLCMSNLCELSIRWFANRPLVELIRALEPITTVSTNSKLAQLCLTIFHNDHPVCDETPLNLASLVGSIQLQSIEHLQLRFCARSHLNYQLLHLESIFPNLCTIHYDNVVANCTICEFKHTDYFDENSSYKLKRPKCINLMVERVVQMRPKPEIIFKYTSRPAYKDIELHL